MAHVLEEAHKITVVLRVDAIVLKSPEYEVIALRPLLDLRLAYAVIERIGQLHVDTLVEPHRQAGAIVERKVWRRIDGLIGVVVDVDIVRQRLVFGDCADDKVVAVLGVLLASLLA